MAKKKSIISDNSTITELGRVVKSTGSSYVVRLDNGEEKNCRVKGNFRIKGLRTTNPVAVGDIVKVAKAADDADYIVAVEPRRNYIIRRASNLSCESHILAANLDLALLVASVKDPETPTAFIDRFLATAEAYSVKAAIVINKEDTWDEDDRLYADALKNLYNTIGYELYFVSAVSGEGLDSLKKILKDKITLLAGNSGVGKSSLINALVPGTDLRTAAISDIHHTGRHTTTFSEMIALPEGGELIDIPGIRGFGTIDFQTEEVDHFFPEIFKKSDECKFGNCLHTGEPGCAVAKAVEDSLISQSRYSSYLSILEETQSKPGDDKYRKPF